MLFDDLLLFPTCIPFIFVAVCLILMFISIFAPIEHFLFHGDGIDTASAEHHVNHEFLDTNATDSEHVHNGILSVLGFKDRVPALLCLLTVSLIMTGLCIFINPYITGLSAPVELLLKVVLLLASFFVSCRLSAIVLKPVAIWIKNNSGVLVKVIGTVGKVKHVMEKKNSVILKIKQGGVDTEINVYLDDITNVVPGDEVIITKKKILEVSKNEVYVGEKIKNNA